MIVTLAGAMSTAKIGRSLAEMIRRDKVHAICCTGANLEEDLYNLIAHNEYSTVDNWRDLHLADERGLSNRVTDTCIPEEGAVKVINEALITDWKKCDEEKKRYFPHEYFYRLIHSNLLKSKYQIDPSYSWLFAACAKDLPIFVPGWEDSTSGNAFAAHCLKGEIKHVDTVRTEAEYMILLAKWYRSQTKSSSVGFFQIGGGIAGDFPICVVPLLKRDFAAKEEVKFWAYFCQVSDSTTSYGSYSGAFPREKITWSKLEEKTPQYMIESDATIVVPWIFAYVLGW